MKTAILLAITMIGAVCTFNGNVNQRGATTYQLRAEVAEINEETGDCFLVDFNNGNEWVYNGLNATVGDQYIMVMSDCGTETIFDDVIDNIVMS